MQARLACIPAHWDIRVAPDALPNLAAAYFAAENAVGARS